jgi:hypothetical protein
VPKTFLILYPSLENSTTGVNIAMVAMGKDKPYTQRRLNLKQLFNEGLFLL